MKENTKQKTQSNIFSFNFAESSSWQKTALISALTTNCKLHCIQCYK